VPLRRGFSVSTFALFLVLAAAELFPSTASAGIGFQPVSPDELKMTSEPLAPGAPAIILYRQVDRDDNGRTSHEDDYIRIKILTEEGRKYANVEIPSYEGGTEVPKVRGRTIRPDGSIAEFDGKVLEQEVEGPRFESQSEDVNTPGRATRQHPRIFLHRGLCGRFRLRIPLDSER
jgi:hypothetical protein